MRRKASIKTLVPAGTGGLFRCTDSGDPLAGREMCWAKIKGHTLPVFLMRVDAGGTYEMQQYDRSLSGTGMQLVFKRLRDGDVVRTVKGRLIKTAN